MLRVIADENMPAVEYFLGASAEVTRVNGRTMKPAQLHNADVLLVRSVTRVEQRLLAGTGVKFVGTATSGIEHVDVEYLKGEGIGFSRAAGSNANSVVEYVLCAIANDGDRLEKLLAGATLGVVGYGLVGRAVVARFTALGVKCRVFDPWLSSDELEQPSSLEHVLACDVICLHAELTQKKPWPSYHLLGEKQLAGLTAQQLLINASRGPVIDNRALKQRLSRPGAPTVVLDVWEGEPELDCVLLDQVRFGTAHVAGYSLDGKILATRMLCETLCAQFGIELAAGDAPRTDFAELSVPTNSNGAASLVRKLLAQRYDIREDDRLLRQACRNSPGSVAGAFDALRKHYPERGELAGSRLDLSKMSDSERAVAQALGCRGDRQ